MADTQDGHVAASAEKTSSGVTRRELFQMSNVLALPVLFGSLDASTSLSAGSAGAVLRPPAR